MCCRRNLARSVTSALGGAGKSFIYCTLYYILRGCGVPVIMMASTGAAATILPRGETVHRSAGLPVPLFSGCEANPKGKIRKRFEEAQVFIWDEVIANVVIATFFEI